MLVSTHEVISATGGKTLSLVVKAFRDTWIHKLEVTGSMELTWLFWSHLTLNSFNLSITRFVICNTNV